MEKLIVGIRETREWEGKDTLEEATVNLKLVPL
jgi:hypothetical protein